MSDNRYYNKIKVDFYANLLFKLEYYCRYI